MNKSKQMIIRALVVIVIISGIFIPLTAKSRRMKSVHIIEILAKDMMFNQTNPTIYLKPGTKVRLILHNEDPGMEHDLVIEALNLKTAIIKEGETAILEFTVPKDGKFAYICSLHPRMMKGFFMVSNQQPDRQTASLK